MMLFQMFFGWIGTVLAKLKQTDSRMEQLDAFKLAKTKPACPRAFVDQNVKRPGVAIYSRILLTTPKFNLEVRQLVRLLRVDTLLTVHKSRQVELGPYRV